MNEIIQHANDDVPSMVEIAYELLLRNDDEEDYEGGSGSTANRSLPAKSKTTPAIREEDILDEFADQCRIIAEEEL